MRYCFDIDGTICSTNCEYKDAKPYQEVIDWINKKNMMKDITFNFLHQGELLLVWIGLSSL